MAHSHDHTHSFAAGPVRPRNRCVILVPVAKYVEQPCEAGLRALEVAGYPVRRIFGHSDIARGRSIIATEALAEGFEELLWIDSDVVFTLADVDRLRSHGEPLVGGLYPLKGKRKMAMTLLEKERLIVFGKGGGLLEVKHVATGFLYTHRSVYDVIAKYHALPRCRGDKPCGIVPYFLSVIVQEGDQHSYLSEDFSFCWRAREAGIRVFADTAIRLGHVGSYTYGWEDAGQPMKRMATYRMNVRGTTTPTHNQLENESLRTNDPKEE
jgi:hypothetical protein